MRQGQAHVPTSKWDFRGVRVVQYISVNKHSGMGSRVVTSQHPQQTILLEHYYSRFIMEGGPSDIINNIISEIDTTPAQHICSHCPKAFRKRAKLLRHVNQSHLNLKPFKCPHCDKEFKRTHHLQRHQLSHSNSRPYKCPQCIGAFNSKDHLSRHIKLMHLKKYLKCETCSQEFLKKSSLRKHQKSHQEEVPKVGKVSKRIQKEKVMYICTFQNCETQFCQYISFRRHFVKTHKKDNQHPSETEVCISLPLPLGDIMTVKEEIFVE